MVGICIYIEKIAGKPVFSRGNNELEHTKRYVQKGNRIVGEKPDNWGKKKEHISVGKILIIT